MRQLVELFLSVLVFVLMVTCKNNSRGNLTETNAPDAAKTSSSNCYLAVLAKDSIWMKLSNNGVQVEGELNYLFYEKDKSRGRMEGSLHGDTLFASFTFLAEGTESKREVAFLKKGNDWVEGYGTMDMETGTRFKNRQSVDFNNKTILKPVPCN